MLKEPKIQTDQNHLPIKHRNFVLSLVQKSLPQGGKWGQILSFSQCIIQCENKNIGSRLPPWPPRYFDVYFMTIFS